MIWQGVCSQKKIKQATSFSPGFEGPPAVAIVSCPWLAGLRQIDLRHYSSIGLVSLRVVLKQMVPDVETAADLSTYEWRVNIKCLLLQEKRERNEGRFSRPRKKQAYFKPDTTLVNFNFQLVVGQGGKACRKPALIQTSFAFKWRVQSSAATALIK